MAKSRTDRDLARGRRAAARVRIHRGSALTAACAQIEATFSPSIYHSILKDRVAALLRRGAAHPDVRLRYRALIGRQPITSLEAAITLARRMRCAELESRGSAVRNCGHCSRSRFTMMRLDEVCLILRLLRRHAPMRFADLMTEIRASDMTHARGAAISGAAAERVGRV